VSGNSAGKKRSCATNALSNIGNVDDRSSGKLFFDSIAPSGYGNFNILWLEDLVARLASS